MFQRTLAFLAALNLALTPTLWAAPKNPDLATIDKTFAVYKASKTYSQFLEKLKSDLPSDHLSFLKAKVEEFKLNQLPAMQRQGPQKFRISVGGSIIPFEFVSLAEGTFKINNKTVTFTPNMSMEERWDAVMKALPAETSAGIMNLILPEAHALFLHVLGGLVVITAGAMGYSINQNECDKIMVAHAQGCSMQKDRVLKWEERRKARVVESEQTRARDAEFIVETKKEYQEKLAYKNSLAAKAAMGCEGKRQKLATCVDELKNLGDTILKADLSAPLETLPAKSTGSAIKGN